MVNDILVHRLNARLLSSIMPPMNNSKIPDNLSYQVFKLLEQNPNISQRELAKMLGVSLGKTNYCLKALVAAGCVKAGNFAKSAHKTKYMYLLTPKGIKEKAAVTVRFLENKQRQYEQLRQEIESLKREASSGSEANE